ncbi:MAG: hypothetical protein KDB23_30090, partial [Planctomycetales bacterium]|nr:hypothetical protein [Planctomycetales bacterium]
MTHLRNPLFRPWAILIVGLLFSIGWGIRGNYGHETGAMLPGALGAIGVCLLSQRPDWHRRVVYFALFGMLGWAFGGSISYMMVIGYTHSGEVTNQYYGYLMLFLIGFLWAGCGGAGTALPAVLDQHTLRAMFRPLLFAIGAWGVMYFALEPLQDWADLRLLGRESLEGLARHERPLYWLDSDWLEVTIVLSALVLCYLIQQRGEGLSLLAVHMALGGVIAYALFWITGKTIGNDTLFGKLVQLQGAGGGRYPDEQLAVHNWPTMFLLLGQRTGVFYAGDVLSLWGGALV